MPSITETMYSFIANEITFEQAHKILTEELGFDSYSAHGVIESWAVFRKT